MNTVYCFGHMGYGDALDADVLGYAHQRYCRSCIAGFLVSDLEDELDEPVVDYGAIALNLVAQRDLTSTGHRSDQ
jgi:hypothetical protein